MIRAALLALALSLGLSLALAGTAGPAAAETFEPSLPETPPRPTLTGIWAGSYVCAQGRTTLYLRLEEVGTGGRVRGVFAFSDHPDNPGPAVPSGCFTVSGRYEPVARRLIVTAERWLVRPEDFYRIDLDGTITPDGMRYQGAILNTTCKGFRLSFANPPPPIDPRCLSAPGEARLRSSR